jgi:hypothetical protein
LSHCRWPAFVWCSDRSCSCACSSISPRSRWASAPTALIAGIDLRRTGTKPEDRATVYARLREAVAAVPGIDAAAATAITPVSNSTWNQRIVVPGYEGTERDRASLFNSVTPDYFRALGTPILTGRDVSAADVAGRPVVVLVNEAFAKKFLSGQNPVGRTFVIDQFGADRKDTQVEIVGMVANAKYRSLRETAEPTTYVPIAQHNSLFSTMFMPIKTAGPPMAAREAVLAAIGSVNTDIVVSFKTFAEDVDAAALQERLIASLSAFFGGLALLAALGLYGAASIRCRGGVTRRHSHGPGRRAGA